jgi:hypothetical protein
MLVIFLYGPPGSGKSSLTAAADREGYPSLDLERAARTHVGRILALGTFLKRASPAMERARFVGTADLTRGECDRLAATHAVRALHVLLLPSRDVYNASRQLRDAMAGPRKASQPDYYDVFAASWAARQFDVRLSWRDGKQQTGALGALLTLAKEYNA